MNPNQPSETPVTTPDPISPVTDAAPTPAPPVAAATAATPPPAKLQARVTYSGALFSIGKNGLLEVGADDHTRLFTIDAKTNQSTGVEFDVAAADIAKVGGNGPILIIHLKDGRKYSFSFSWGAVAASAIGGGGLLGIAAENKMVQASGVPQWIDEYTRNNVAITYLSPWAMYRKVFIYTLIGVGVLFVIICIYVAFNPSA